MLGQRSRLAGVPAPITKALDRAVFRRFMLIPLRGYASITVDAPALKRLDKHKRH
jgi:hypothetical protein